MAKEVRYLLIYIYKILCVKLAFDHDRLALTLFSIGLLFPVVTIRYASAIDIRHPNIYASAKPKQ